MSDLSIVDNAFDSVGSAGEAALDAVVGGADAAIDVAARPRRSVARARRRGQAVNREIADTVDDLVDTATALPERVLVAYLRGLRRQAHRDDVLGAASRTILDAVNGSAREAARFFARVERVSTTPARRTRPATATAAHRRTTTRRGRATGTTRGRKTAAARGTRRRSAAR